MGVKLKELIYLTSFVYMFYEKSISIPFSIDFYENLNTSGMKYIMIEQGVNFLTISECNFKERKI